MREKLAWLLITLPASNLFGGSGITKPFIKL